MDNPSFNVPEKADPNIMQQYTGMSGKAWPRLCSTVALNQIWLRAHYKHIKVPFGLWKKKKQTMYHMQLIARFQVRHT